MEKTEFTVDDVSETSSNTRETQCSGSAIVRPRLCAQHVLGRPMPRQPPCSAGFRGEPCEGERVCRHPHPGAVCVSETPSKNAVASISLLLDANPCSQPSARAQTALPSPCSVEPRGRQGSGRGLRHRRVFPGRWLVQSSPSVAPHPRLSAAGPRGRVTLRTSLTRSSLKPCVHSALGPGPRQGWAWAVVSVVSLGHPGRKTRL